MFEFGSRATWSFSLLFVDAAAAGAKPKGANLAKNRVSGPALNTFAARLGRRFRRRQVVVIRTKNLHKFREAVRTATSAAGFEAHAPCLQGDACPPYAAKVVSGAYTGLCLR